MKRGRQSVALWVTMLVVGALLSTGVSMGQTVQANVAPSISNVRVSNVRDSYFVVSWITDEASSGEIRYGTSPGLGEVAYDVRGAGHSSQTHYVAVTDCDSASTSAARSTATPRTGTPWSPTRMVLGSRPRRASMQGVRGQEIGTTNNGSRNARHRLSPRSIPSVGRWPSANFRWWPRRRFGGRNKNRFPA